MSGAFSAIEHGGYEDLAGRHPAIHREGKPLGDESVVSEDSMMGPAVVRRQIRNRAVRRDLDHLFRERHGPGDDEAKRVKEVTR